MGIFYPIILLIHVKKIVIFFLYNVHTGVHLEEIVNNKIWSLIDVLNEGKKFLQRNHVENARLNAEVLLASVLGLSRIELYLHFEKPLKVEEREQFKQLLRKRAKSFPLQYLLKRTEFMGWPFQVNPHVLIPRPETEILVEKALSLIPEKKSYRILDIGTGSGVISISIAKVRRDVQLTAIDVSPEALDVARGNACLNNVSDQITWICGDILESSSSLNELGAFDMVVSNPPYVTRDEWERLAPEIKSHEPRIALCDEADGLTFYRTISVQSRNWLSPGGVVLVEVGDKQSKPVYELFKKEQFDEICVYNDLNGIGRVVQSKRLT